MILNAKITATQAAREGARSSVILPEEADYIAAAESNVAIYMANIGKSSGYSADATVLSSESATIGNGKLDKLCTQFHSWVTESAAIGINSYHEN